MATLPGPDRPGRSPDENPEKRRLLAEHHLGPSRPMRLGSCAFGRLGMISHKKSQKSTTNRTKGTNFLEAEAAWIREYSCHSW